MGDSESNEFARMADEWKAASRGHADYWSWETDRDIAEAGVVDDFIVAMERAESIRFRNAKHRGHDDPPDCEATDEEGRRWGLEVTELVRGANIAAARAGEYLEPTYWEAADVISEISARIQRKDFATEIKGGPYERYAAIIYTDEPFLAPMLVEGVLQENRFGPVRLLTDAFVLMSYDPHCGYQPLFRVGLDGSQQVGQPDRATRGRLP